MRTSIDVPKVCPGIDKGPSGKVPDGGRQLRTPERVNSAVGCTTGQKNHPKYQLVIPIFLLDLAND